MATSGKKSKVFLVIVLMLVIDVCVIAFVIGKKNNLILRAEDDSLAPTIKAGDIILFKPVKDFDQLHAGDIISYNLYSYFEVMEIGQIQAVYHTGNGLAYELVDSSYAATGWNTIVQYWNVEGQFVAVIYNNTIGIILLSVVVLTITLLFLKRRHDKRAFGSENQNSFAPTETSISTDIPYGAELLQYKRLLDMGAITSEEFEAKKKELLGL